MSYQSSETGWHTGLPLKGATLNEEQNGAVWGSEDRPGGNGSRGVKPEARAAMASGPPHSGLAALTTETTVGGNHLASTMPT